MTDEQLIEELPHTSRLPAMFVGHGSPMSAVEDNTFTRTWEKMGESIGNISAILCISAHWETDGTFVTTMDKPRTIHDFSGFPKDLYDLKYPAPGATVAAQATRDLINLSDDDFHISADKQWGLDHGTWSVLIKMFPKADIPTYQLSIDRSKPMAYHYELGKRLAGLRQRGVLIIGSGNIVHNLRRMQNTETGFDWAIEFDSVVAEKILADDHQALVDFQQFGAIAELSVPTNEHYVPLLYVLGAQHPDDKVVFKNESITMGSLSMRSFVIPH